MMNFSPRAQQVLALARKEADRFCHNFVGTEHLLLGLLKLGQGTAVAVLLKFGVNLDSVRTEVEKQVGRGPDEKRPHLIPYTPRVKKVLSLAVKEARALKHTYVGTEHILLGLLGEPDGVAGRVLRNVGVSADVGREHILKELDPNYLSTAEGFEAKPVPQKSHRAPVDVSKRYDVYCREGQEEVVYQNALFKGIATLFSRGDHDVYYEYVELEQADGQTVMIARWSITKFCEHGGKPGPQPTP